LPFFFLYIIRKGLIESISTWWRRNYNMKYLKSYKQPTDISALLGRHKKSWWDGRVCQVFRSHLGHDKRKVLTNEFKVKSTCHPNSASLNYLANGSKAARNVVMIIISTIKEKIPEKKKRKSPDTRVPSLLVYTTKALCVYWIILITRPVARSLDVVTASFSLLFGHRPSSPKRKEKYQRPSIHFDRRQNWARIISPKSQTNARAPNKQKFNIYSS
jgi:hypothetical protein